LAKELNSYIKSLGFNILNQNIEGDRIHYFIQTDSGLDEIVIDNNLWINPHFKSAIEIYSKIQEHITDEFRDRDLLKLLDEIESSAKKGAYIQRYKGLGEMNPEQLWDTTMNPDNRRLLKIVINDDEVADDTFVLFMGDNVELRRKHIEKHAKDVNYLDI